MFSFDEVEYRNILRGILDARITKNPNYSQRSFARDLSFSSSNLSEVLSGKKGISQKKAKNICVSLGFSHEQVNFFCDLVKLSDSRSEGQKEIVRARIGKFRTHQYNQIKEDTLSYITGWEHFAILELTHVAEFRPSFKWVARALEVSEEVVESAVNCLMRLNLLRIEDEMWIDCGDFLETSDDVKSEHIRKLNLQLINKAMLAAENQQVEERNISSVVMAVSKEDIEMASNEIREFQYNLNKRLSLKEKKDRVYCLAVQFYDLSYGLKQG